MPRKFLSVLLCLALVFTMAAPAFAQEQEAPERAPRANYETQTVWDSAGDGHVMAATAEYTGRIGRVTVSYETSYYHIGTVTYKAQCDSAAKTLSGSGSISMYNFTSAEINGGSVNLTGGSNSYSWSSPTLLYAATYISCTGTFSFQGGTGTLLPTWSLI